MKVLIFDTETSGLLPKSVVSLTQIPYIVQLCYLVYDTDSHVIETHNDYIRVPASVDLTESQKIHGISRSRLDEVGIDMLSALIKFGQHYRTCDFVVAHNIEFDIKMVNYECVRNDISPIIHKYDPTKVFYCTMAKGVKICKIEKLTKTGKTYFKWPKLIELHEHLFNQTPYKLHDAYHDNLVCLRCFNSMQFGNDLLADNDRFRREFNVILQS